MICVTLYHFSNFICMRSCYNNAYFAKVGGISTSEMNHIEREFLFGLNFRLNVTPTVYHSYCTYLQREMCLDNPVVLLRSQCSLSEIDESSKNNTHKQQKQHITLWVWDLSSFILSFFPASQSVIYCSGCSVQKWNF